MDSILILSKAIIALSIAVVWVFRFDNIVAEFQQYGLSTQVRSMVGAVKIVMATLLVTSIWDADLVLFPAIVMAFLMLCAQYFHFRVRNPFFKYLPSLGLFCLSMLLIAAELGWIG